MMEPSMCCRLVLLGGMLITVAANNFVSISTTAIAPNTSLHGNHTNTTSYGTRDHNHHINETSTALPSTNTSERTTAPANKTTRSHGTMGPTTSWLKSTPSMRVTQPAISRTSTAPSSEVHSNNLAYVIIIIVIIVCVLTIPCFCVFKRKKGYNVDNHEDADVPLSARDQDAFESSSPKEITPELKTFTANETSTEPKGPMTDAVLVTVGDGKVSLKYKSNQVSFQF